MSSTGGAPPIFPVNEKFDGTNWITWSENILIAAHMRGVYGYLTGTIKKPVLISTIPTKLATTLTKKEPISSTPVSVIPAPTEVETN